ncbi:DUF58 domain-containing protein [Psychrobacillus sp.]|uniref:DUF58 domain-containing protein n=1 Tax=Psychrobacillus sp. TaxID=1871623 RepID=UPI0028BE00E6|nr:DUF58 domain-containing protein [Psychrobacillus sp.]
MIWSRQDFGMRNTKMYVQLLVVSFLISVLLKQYVFVAVIFLLLMVGFMQVYYYRNVGKKLELVNVKKRVRLMKGSANFFELTFENKGLPIWNSRVIIAFQTAVAPIGTQVNTTHLHEIRIPLSIGYKKRITVKVPIEGVQRGISKIKELEVQIPHPLTAGSVILHYQRLILVDAIVFPQINKMQETLLPSKFKQGDLELSSSLFDDPFFPIGTREYVPGDQFHHIHWKASAKMQQLQTKVFTKVANVSVLFVVNVVEKYSVVADFEDKIEWLASHIDACYKQNIPFAFAINIRTFGKTPFVFLPSGSGDAHRIKALELLSILSKNDSFIPFEKIITYLESHEDLPVAIHIMTHRLEQYKPLLQHWEERTNVMYRSEVQQGGNNRDE